MGLKFNKPYEHRDVTTSNTNNPTIFKENIEIPRLWVDKYTLGGNNAKITFKTTQKGGDPNVLFYEKVPADWFRVIHPIPQLTVDSNQVAGASKHVGSANFQFLQKFAPELAQITTSDGQTSLHSSQTAGNIITQKGT